jgi:hypothetical protein
VLNRRRILFGLVSGLTASTASASLSKEFASVSETSPSRLRVVFAGPEKTSKWQPLALDGFDHLRMNASLGGLAVPAILDSGAARTVVDKEFARQIGLSIHGGFNIVGVTKVTDGATAHLNSLTVGEMQVNDIEVAILDLSTLNAPKFPAPQLLLGREFFEAATVDIDLPGSRVQFAQAGSNDLLIPDAEVLPLRETPGGSRCFPITINGVVTADAVFDLGYNAPLLVSPEFAARYRLLDSRPLSTVASFGVDGMVISQVATVDHIAIGHHTLTNVPIEVPPTWTRSVPIFAGLPLLSRFSILTDYSRDRISLLPDPALAKTDIAKDHSGIGALPVSNGLRVIHVSSGSPAERAGLNADDIIVAINGLGVDAAYLSTHPRMGTMPVGTHFDLKLSDGRHLSMVLADYY